jgi:hypothetical protein
VGGDLGDTIAPDEAGQLGASCAAIVTPVLRIGDDPENRPIAACRVPGGTRYDGTDDRAGHTSPRLGTAGNGSCSGSEESRGRSSNCKARPGVFLDDDIGRMASTIRTSPRGSAMKLSKEKQRLAEITS